MNIDTSTIEGFDSMSADDKVSALLGLDISPDPDKFMAKADYDKAKASFDKTASELAALKKEKAAKMTEDEKSAAATAEKQKELEDKYNDLLKRSTIADYKAQYMAQGYSAELAADTAEAMYSGDMAKVFANAVKFNEELAKKIKADVLKDTPKPGGNGGGSDGDTDEIKLAKSIGAAKAKAGSVADTLHKYY